jgi:hypothetical protein
VRDEQGFEAVFSLAMLSPVACEGEEVGKIYFPGLQKHKEIVKFDRMYDALRYTPIVKSFIEQA